MAYNHDDDGIGPQGTQAFNSSDVNIMIAEEIIKSQSDQASIPALIAITGEFVGNIYPLQHDKTTIGRSNENSLIIPSPGVSSSHAYIRKTPDGLKLMNLLSSNGTYVNGEKVSEKKIWRGDRIAFADAEFIFAFVDEPVAENNRSGLGWNLRLAIIILGLFIASILAVYYLS